MAGKSSQHCRSDGSGTADHGAQGTHSLGHKMAPLSGLKPQSDKVGTLPRRRDANTDGKSPTPSDTVYQRTLNFTVNSTTASVTIASFASLCQTPLHLPSTPQPTHRSWSPCTAWVPACTARGQLQPRTPPRSAWWLCRRWSGSIWLPGAARQHPTGPPWPGDPTRGLAQIPPTTGILPQTAQRKGNTVSVNPHEDVSVAVHRDGCNPIAIRLQREMICRFNWNCLLIHL